MSFVRSLVNRLPERQAADINSHEMVELLRAGSQTASGVHVTPDNALTFSAVFACCRVLAEGVAALPWITYQRNGANKDRATDHYLYPLLHDGPNLIMTSIAFRTALMFNANLWGNGYAEIVLDGAGRVAELWPLLSRYMDPPTFDREGVLIYPYHDPIKGLINFPFWRIFHVLGPSLDGLHGMTPVKLHRQAIGLGLAEERFGATFFGNGARPGVALKHPGQLSDKSYQHLVESWEGRHGGVENANRLAILEEGMDLETFGVPPDDAQFLQSRKFQVSEIARIYRVPAHLIGDMEHATFGNIEQQSLEYVIYTLQPWITAFEQATQMRLLLPREKTSIFTEMLVDALLRGDIVARYNAYNIARNIGVLSADEIRAKENMNPEPNNAGQGYWSPLNMNVVGAPGTAGQQPTVLPG